MRKYVTTAGLAALLAMAGSARASEGERTRDQGTMEDTLGNQSSQRQSEGSSGSAGTSMREGQTAQPGQPKSSGDRGISETAVPGREQTVSGKIAKLDEKSGYFTLKTEAGKSVKLHADPSLLKQQAMTQGSEVTAHYEMRGKMKHVTMLEPGTPASGAQPSTNQQQEPSPSAPGGQR